MSEPSAVDVSVEEGSQYKEPFDGLSGEMRALPPERIRDVNTDVWFGVNTVLASMPKIRAQKDKLVATFAKFDPASIDRLQQCALALNYAQRVCKASSPEVSGYQPKLQIGIKRRDMHKADMEALVKRELIDGTRLKELQGGNTHRFVSNDLFVLHQVASANWSTIQGKTAITQDELAETEQMAHDLGLAVAEHEHDPKVASAALDTRDRAYTLFLEAYDNVRGDLSYMCSKDGTDVDDILPSIFAGKASGRTAPAPKPAAAPAASEPAPAHEAPAAPAAAVRVGMPGASPYVAS